MKLFYSFFKDGNVENKLEWIGYLNLFQLKCINQNNLVTYILGCMKQDEPLVQDHSAGSQQQDTNLKFSKKSIFLSEKYVYFTESKCYKLLHYIYYIQS